MPKYRVTYWQRKMRCYRVAIEADNAIEAIHKLRANGDIDAIRVPERDIDDISVGSCIRIVEIGQPETKQSEELPDTLDEEQP